MKKQYKARLHALVLAALCSIVPVSAGAAAVVPGDVVLAGSAISKSEIVNTAAKPEGADATSKSKMGNAASKSEVVNADSESESTKSAEEAKTYSMPNSGITPQLVSHSFTTVDNKQLPLPKDVTVFDFKRMVTPMGIIDGTQVAAGNSMNENYVENIRRRAVEAKLPEFKNFSGQIYRDWNMYQLQGKTAEAHHTAYVTEIALGPDFINGERADLAISKAMLKRAKENPSQPYYDLYDSNMPVPATVGALQTGAYYLENMADILNYSVGDTDDDRASNARQVLFAMFEDNMAKQEQYLKLYPHTYDGPAYYNATWANLQSMPFMENARSANDLVTFYKQKFTDAVTADLGYTIIQMDKELQELTLAEHELSHQPQSEYKIEGKPEKWLEHFENLEDLRNKLEIKQNQLAEAKFFYSHINTFMNTSTVVFDQLENKQVHSKVFGDMIQSDVRGALYFDSYELPLGAMSFLRFDEQGPVFTLIVTNDGNFDYWQEQVKDIWQLESRRGSLKASAEDKANLVPAQAERLSANTASQNEPNLMLSQDKANVMTIRKLSDAVLIPFLLREGEKDLQRRIEEGPDVRHWLSKQFLTGEELEASQEHYKKLLHQAAMIDMYRLGEKTEVYQLQVAGESGRKTATVLSLVLTPEVSQNMGARFTKEQMNAMLPRLNYQWLHSEKPLNQKIHQWLNFTGANHFTYNSIKLADQLPITAVRLGDYDAYRAGSRVFVNINGVELPYYVDGALVYTYPYPTALLLITSDAERTAFIPQFENFIANL